MFRKKSKNSGGLRSLAHLWEQIGVARQRVLTDPQNTGRLKVFLDALSEEKIMREGIQIGDRVYEAIPVLRPEERPIRGQLMVKRAMEVGACLDEKDGQYILDRQNEIPPILRGKMWFVFPLWSIFGYSGEATYFSWDRFHWIGSGETIDGWWGKGFYFLRRKDMSSGGVSEKDLPTEITVAGRTYDIVGFKADEEKPSSNEIDEWALKADTYLGPHDGEHLLKHQDQIPKILRGRVMFVFPGWQHPNMYNGICFIYWRNDLQKWVPHWFHVTYSHYWGENDRFLRRKNSSLDDEVDEKSLPTEIVMEDRAYDILDILQGEEKSVDGRKLPQRAKKMNAHLGSDDEKYILGNQRDIPWRLQEQVAFVFTDTAGRSYVSYDYWSAYFERWVTNRSVLDRPWGRCYRVLRRRK